MKQFDVQSKNDPDRLATRIRANQDKLASNPAIQFDFIACATCWRRRKPTSESRSTHGPLAAVNGGADHFVNLGLLRYHCVCKFVGGMLSSSWWIGSRVVLGSAGRIQCGVRPIPAGSRSRAFDPFAKGNGVYSSGAKTACSTFVRSD